MDFENDKKAFLTDLENSVFNICGDYEETDAVEVLQHAVESLQKKIEELQHSVSLKVEELVDSFGGVDCTMRQLKGE